MRDYILLYVNGRRHEVRGPFVFQPLSTFLRETLHLTGTKIVCAEGDCGSCTVLLGRADDSGKIDARPVCSCIQYVCQLDCTHVITVEGLSYDGELNPLQESFVKHHGAQCGFCTPGFVVCGAAMLDKNPRPSEGELRRGFVGNLCRCTGYEPILKAGMDVDAAKLRKIDSLFDTAAIARELAAKEKNAVRVESAGQILLKPATVAEGAKFLAENPGATLLAGGTDIGVFVNKGKKELKTVISLSGLAEMRGIKVERGAIVAGAACSLMDLEEICRKHLPEYERMLERFGSPPIRNAGTIGGNIGNGSPIGDSMPAMFSLNTEIELTSSRGVRTVNINDFYTGYRKSVLAADELITRVRIPLPAEGELFRIYKVSKRLDLDISTFGAAIWACVSAEKIADIRITFNGIAATILRMKKTEAALQGQPFSEAAFANAGMVARSEITPLTDVRGSADYRLLLAENTLARFYSDCASVI